MQATIELVEVNSFLILRINVDSIFNATLKTLHYCIRLLNIERVHTHEIVEVFDFTVFTYHQIKSSVKYCTYTVLTVYTCVCGVIP